LTATAVELARLAAKYRRMGELRRAFLARQAGRADDHRARAGVGGEREEDRRALRALAAEWPGALRELDTLPTDEIDGRAAALERAAAASSPEPWMEWLLAYHALMRAVLRLKAGGGRLSPSELQRIAEETGVPVDAELARAVADPPHGRLMVVVFERLSARFGVGRRALWDALFPPRRGPRPYR
jgi:hypothetical protein